MIAEHWVEVDGDIIFGLSSFSRDKHGLSENATFCCLIHGKDWNDIMTKYHEHMGWEPYRSVEDK